jgi:ADP-ribose pyrophosphatase YjhB (NUDIX family)
VGIELKLSIGASPNGEGVWENLTQEQQIVRGAAPGVSVKVPARFLCIPSDATMHQQIDHFLDLVHQIKRLHNVARRKLFLGVKCAFSNDEFFVALANKLRIIKRFDTNSDATIDYIHIDGAEGGTVAGHPSMTDKVGLPGFHSIRRVRQIFDAAEVDTKLALSGRLITPADVCIALALGADWVLTARGAMLATGCIQARVCSSGECPTGITTNDPWRLRGVIPEQKSVRLFRYFLALREGVAMIARSAGLKFRPNQRTFTDKHLVLVQPLPLNDFLARPPEQAKKGTPMQAVGILVPVREDEKRLIVTINRKETPHVPDLPVGLPGPDEDLKTAALRELREETGCVATIIDTPPFEDIDQVDGTHVTIFLGHFISQDETEANRTEGVPTRSTYDALARFGKYHEFNKKCLAFFREKL